MALTRLFATAAFTALCLRSAVADPALAVSDVNMRTGPALNAPVIMLIPGGSNVEVLSCAGGWCEVSIAGRAGFANQRFFDFGGDPPPGPREAPPVRGAYPSPPPGYGYGPPPYPQPEPQYYPPGYRGPVYAPPPYPSPYGLPADDEDDERDALPPPGLDPRMVPPRPPVNRPPPPPRPAQAAPPRPPANAPARPPQAAPQTQQPAQQQATPPAQQNAAPQQQAVPAAPPAGQSVPPQPTAQPPAPGQNPPPSSPAQ